jgi:hypothetical protein
MASSSTKGTCEASSKVSTFHLNGAVEAGTATTTNGQAHALNASA